MLRSITSIHTCVAALCTYRCAIDLSAVCHNMRRGQFAQVNSTKFLLLASKCSALRSRCMADTPEKKEERTVCLWPTCSPCHQDAVTRCALLLLFCVYSDVHIMCVQIQLCGPEVLEYMKHRTHVTFIV